MAKRLKKESKFHKFVKEHFMIVVMLLIDATSARSCEFGERTWMRFS